MDKTYYNEILTEHNLRPYHKRAAESHCCSHRGFNPSCGDDITLSILLEDDKIKELSFSGDGCAVSQASCDIMIDLVLDKTKDEALRLADIFHRMITDSITEEEKEELGEAVALEDISKNAARTKCAMLGWRTLEKALKD